VRLLIGYDSTVADWVAERIPQLERGTDFGPLVALGVVDARGELAAGVVFHGFVPKYRAIEASFAASSSRWLTRPLASAIMAYPFGQLGVQRVGTRTPRRNRRARDFVERFGFKREGLIRRGFGDDDMVLSGNLACARPPPGSGRAGGPVSTRSMDSRCASGSRSRNPTHGQPILAPGP
jgi:RimJ/RimL family protein N-acetyltransferase